MKTNNLTSSKALKLETFKSHFEVKKKNLVYEDYGQRSELSHFTSGVTDAVALISELYDSGRLDLTFRTNVIVRFNELGEYAKECRLSDEVDLDEFTYPLFERYYYAGVHQIFELLNRDFIFELKL